MGAAVKPGTLLMIHHGQYSDQDVDGFFVVLSEFDPEERRRAFIATFPADDEDLRPRSEVFEAFVAFLIRGGSLLEIESADLFLGAYDLGTNDDWGATFKFTPLGAGSE